MGNSTVEIMEPHFDGTTLIYNNGDIYKHRYMYVYDVETSWKHQD